MCAAFVRLRDNAMASIDRYFQECQSAEQDRELECDAAVRIQRTWRGHNARSYLNYLSDQATHVQRVWRGYVVRKRCDRIRRQKKIAMEEQYYSMTATLIQKLWRGHMSRKTKEDYHKRAEWVNTTRMRAEALRQEMNAAMERQRLEEQERKELNASKKFDALAENLHHLVSTKAIPGVFNSRFGEMYQITAFDIPMDDHIRDAFKNRREREKLERESRQIKRLARRVSGSRASSRGSSAGSRSRQPTADTISGNGLQEQLYTRNPNFFHGNDRVLPTLQINQDHSQQPTSRSESLGSTGRSARPHQPFSSSSSSRGQKPPPVVHSNQNTGRRRNPLSNSGYNSGRSTTGSRGRVSTKLDVNGLEDTVALSSRRSKYVSVPKQLEPVNADELTPRGSSLAKTIVSQQQQPHVVAS